MSKSAAEIKPVIEAAIAKAIQQGIPVRSGAWGIRYALEGDTHWARSGSECLCPMGCVIVGTEIKGDLMANKLASAAAILGVRPSNVEDFIYGFDGEDHESPYPSEFYLLGQEFRDRATYLGKLDFGTGIE